MSLVKIGTLLLVSAVVACLLFVVIVVATPRPDPDAPFSGWQTLGTLLLFYWLGAAVAGAILLLVNFFNSSKGELTLSDIWPLSRREDIAPHPAASDRSSSRASSGVGSVRESVFCNKCGAQNRRGQRFCDSCENPLPV